MRADKAGFTGRPNRKNVRDTAVPIKICKFANIELAVHGFARPDRHSGHLQSPSGDTREQISQEKHDFQDTTSRSTIRCPEHTTSSGAGLNSPSSKDGMGKRLFRMVKALRGTNKYAYGIILC